MLCDSPAHYSAASSERQVYTEQWCVFVLSLSESIFCQILSAVEAADLLVHLPAL